MNFHELFDCDFERGELYKKGSTKPLGHVFGTGYLVVKIKSQRHFVHRILWQMRHGDLPEFLDHIDQNPLNNRIENLRPATKQQNSCNAKVRADNTSGFKGVHRARINWVALISVNGKRKHIGSFETAIEAARAYDAAAKQLHGEFAFTNGT